MSETQMPPLTLLFILLIMGIIAGAIRTNRLITTSRKAAQSPDTHCEWSEMPLSSWKYEPFAAAAILIHTLSILFLGVVALRAASNRGILSNPSLIHDTTMILLVWFIQCGSISIIGYQLGLLMIAFPRIVFRRDPVTYTITDKGMALGQNFLPWRWFSHFSIDRDEGILRLYSAFSSDLSSLTSRPPASGSLEDLGEIIQRYLPLRPPECHRAWYQTKFLLIPTMLFSCLSVVAIGWLASHLSLELALFVIALLTTILTFLGGLVINIFAFGVLTTRGNSSRQPPTT
jgi:hypothetical protein